MPFSIRRVCFVLSGFISVILSIGRFCLHFVLGGFVYMLCIVRFCLHVMHWECDDGRSMTQLMFSSYYSHRRDSAASALVLWTASSHMPRRDRGGETQHSWRQMISASLHLSGTAGRG